MPDKNEILKYLDYSEDARLNEKDLLKIYPNAYFIEDPKTDTQGYILVRQSFTNPVESNIVIAFRGTQQPKDWLTDLNAVHMIFPYGNLDTKIMVHRGFMMAYLSVRSAIHSLLKTFSNTIHEVTVTGHSLGGALATLCAVDIQYNFSFHVQCYTSGNPMVGNKFFVESYNIRVPCTVRTYMKNDIVPMLPPEWFEKVAYEGYSHAGQPFPIGPCSWLFSILTWIRKVFHKKDKLLDNLFNHDISTYRSEIIKLIFK